MKNKKALFISLLTVSLTLSSNLFAQGCSDAGVCTIDAFRGEKEDSTKLNVLTVKLGANIGAADYDISVYGGYLNLIKPWNEKWQTDFRITSLGQNGNGINTFGLSDIYLVQSYQANKKVKFTGGLKIPLQDGNAQLNGLSLPMDYQASLGTFDAILGVAWQINKFNLSAALQQPLTQNKNEFNPENFSDTLISRIQNTNQFDRAGDVIARVTYPFTLKKFVITPGLLAIYHLREDRYAFQEAIRTIDGSEGFTLNFNAYIDYQINPVQKLQLTLGTPFLVREARPDGLTRAFVLNLEYQYNITAKHKDAHP